MVVNVRMSGGEKDYKELMNKFEFVSNAFLNLDEGYLFLPSLFSRKIRPTSELMSNHIMYFLVK